MNIYKTFFLCMIFNIPMFAEPNVPEETEEHDLLYKAAFGLSLLCSGACGLYTLAVFSKSQLVSPAARLLLAPIGAASTAGSLLTPYILFTLYYGYKNELALSSINLNFSPASRPSRLRSFMTKLLMGIGAVVAAVCVAALCGNQQAIDLLNRADSTNINIF